MKLIINLGCFFLLCNTYLSSQFVEDYKERIAEKHYIDFLQKEEKISQTNGLLQKGELYYELGLKCLRYQEELALKYEIEALNIFQEVGHDSLYHMVLCSMVYPYIGKGEYDKAGRNLEKGLAYWKKMGDKRWLGHTYLKMAYLAKERGQLVKSLKYNLECYKIHKSYRPIEEMGTCFSGLVNLYKKVGDCENVVKYANEYLNGDSSLVSKGYITLIKHNSADCFYTLGQDSIARQFEKETASMYRNSSSFKLKSYSYLTLADVNKDNILLHKSYLDSAYHFAKLFGNGRYISLVYDAYYNYWLNAEKYTIAKNCLDSMLLYAASEKFLDGILDSYRYYSEFYKSQNDYKNAFIYNVKADSVHNILYSQEMLNDLKQLDLSIQQSQNDEKIQLLEEQNKLKEINLVNERRIKIGLGFLLFLVLGIIFLLYNIIKSRVKKNSELSAKNAIITKALSSNKMLIKEIHHRVKNNLQVVSSLLFLQSRFVDDETAKRAIKTGRSRVQAMSILHQKLYKKDNLKSLNVKEYFEDLVHNLFHTYNLHDSKVAFELFIDDIELDIDTVVPLGLIANELISNSLKHAFDHATNGIIIFRLEKKNNQVCLYVKDNGKGLPFTEIPEKSGSLGFELIKSFSEKLNANIFIDNTDGTLVEIVFELT